MMKRVKNGKDKVEGGVYIRFKVGGEVVFGDEKVCWLR